MRIEDIITGDESTWYFNNFSPLHMYFYRRWCIATTNENLNFDFRLTCTMASLPVSSSYRSPISVLSLSMASSSLSSSSSSTSSSSSSSASSNASMSSSSSSSSSSSLSSLSLCALRAWRQSNAIQSYSAASVANGDDFPAIYSACCLPLSTQSVIF